MRVNSLIAHTFLLSLFTTSLAAKTSPNDLFRAISTRVVRAADEPVCCLVPPEDTESHEDDVLLSFEQWKEKQASIYSLNRSTAPTTAHRVEVSPPSDPGTAVQEPSETQLEQLSPHFKVPLIDRFNYAGLDCSARVHLSHRSAKSPSSILSSKKDRYMLSPCNSPEEKFVVVELCDDIRIDTVQLANFEFFSGVFKEFTVSVAKTHATSEKHWTVVGTYTADNVRGVQSFFFHPKSSIRDFYRYIRIQFHSHYGNEYYCPISLLRVYGLTHLEQWKWDTWEAEYREEESQIAQLVEEPEQVHIPVVESDIPTSQDSKDAPSPEVPFAFPVYGPSTYDSTLPDASTSTTPTLKTDSVPLSDHNGDRHGHDQANRHPTDIYSDDISSGVRASEASVSSNHRKQTTVPVSPSSSSHSSDVTSHETVSGSNPTPTRPTTLLSPSISITIPAPPPMPPSTGGESIYRTIMNRLTALEGNHTLYVRYVEEQTTGSRELIRRLGEDIGRLEGIGKAQAQTYQKKLREWEKQRRRIELEYMELSHRVEHLSDEVILEKRLGIAQLCLLLAVLVFMGLTRGSRNDSADHAPLMFRKGMREWGRRHLSFSGDWFARSRDRTPDIKRSPKPIDFRVNDPFKRSPRPANDVNKVHFPSASAIDSVSRYTSPKPEPKPMISAPLLFPFTEPRVANSKPSRDRSRSHTPNPLRTPINLKPLHRDRPSTPTLSSRPPQLMRSNSGHLVMSGVPKSARRWARTAHLHEVRRRNVKREDVGDGDDPFVSPANGQVKLAEYAAHRDPWLSRGGGVGSDDGEGSGSGDVEWLDTDASVDGTEEEEEEEEEEGGMNG